MGISWSSEDPVLVNFLSGPNCWDKAFKVPFSLQGFKKQAVLVLNGAKSGGWKKVGKVNY